MSLVFAGVCGHGPGITSRAEQADPAAYLRFRSAYARMAAALRDARPDVLIIIAAEHFANFFMNNMPAFAIGMADDYEGPIEDPSWLKIPRRVVPGSGILSRKFIDQVIQSIDVSYCEEWRLDHGIMVPLLLLTPDYNLPIIPVNINCQAPPMAPLARAYAFGEALRSACDCLAERIAIIGTGGISHWPCTPDSGKINADWDRDFLDRWCRNDRAALTDYSDQAIYRDAGQGGYEIRTYIAAAGAAGGACGELWCYEPIPAFACGCTVAVMGLKQSP